MKQLLIVGLLSLGALNVNAAGSKIWDTDLASQSFSCDNGQKLQLLPIFVNGVRVGSNFDVQIGGASRTDGRLIASWSTNLIESGVAIGSLDIKQSPLDFTRKHISSIAMKISDAKVEMSLITPEGARLTCRNF